MTEPPTPRPRRRFASVTGLVLLCGHCALGGLLAALGALGLLSVPTLFGVDWNWIWPPVAILGGFALYLWSGREPACPVDDA